MTKFVQDSYNGLYKVLLKPYVPKATTLVALLAGVVIGLFWAYVVSPAVYYDADPSTLHQSWQDEWVKLIADRNALANFDVGENVTFLLSRVDEPLAIVDRLLATPGEEANYAKLQAIRPFAEAAQATAVTAPSPSALGNILPYILGPLVVGILFVLGAIVYGMFIGPNLVEPVVRRLRGEKTSADVQAMKAQVQAVKQAEAASKSDFSTSTYGPPLMQRMSTYILGHGQYDDSFSIEDEQKRFLGECGAEISETIGVGEPQRATALEVWLFDKDDFVRTVTKVFCSEHAFNDPGLRAKLELRGDLVLAQPGATAVLETATLRIQARVVDIEYGPGPMPTRSFFQKLTLELAAWHKDSSEAPAPTAPPVVVPVAPPAPVLGAPPQIRPEPATNATPMPAVTRPIAPMPAAPAPVARPPVAAPPVPVMPPASPPPRPPAIPVPEEDPFGGAADF
ncbi:MAG TPA: hypothetical protein VER79_11095 [Candidatus Limnocylindrales bacterium]|nr:hypothetical protein [Candidatus Limnocylindrales bacterium]